jgi:hypothetical protein
VSPILQIPLTGSRKQQIMQAKALGRKSHERILGGDHQLL